MEFSLFGHHTIVAFYGCPHHNWGSPIFNGLYHNFREYRLMRGLLSNLVMFAYVWNLLSTDKINAFHFSGSISKYAEHHFFRFRIICTDKNGLRDDLLPNNPPLRRYLRIIHKDTFCKILQLADTSLAAKKGSFFEMRQICLLSLIVVFNGLPLFSKSDTDFVYRNLIQTLPIVVLYAILKSVLICRKGAPWYLFIIINFLTESIIFSIFRIIS